MDSLHRRGVLVLVFATERLVRHPVQPDRARECELSLVKSQVREAFGADVLGWGTSSLTGQKEPKKGPAPL
jgi:hypothetical protein